MDPHTDLSSLLDPCPVPIPLRERRWTAEGSLLLEVLTDSAFHLKADFIHIRTQSMRELEDRTRWAGSPQQKAIVKMQIDGIMADHSCYWPWQIVEIIDAAWTGSSSGTRPRTTRDSGSGILDCSRNTELAGIRQIQARFQPAANQGEYLILEILHNHDADRQVHQTN